MHFDPDLRILFVTGTGVVTYADVMEHLESEEARKLLGERELVDVSVATTDLNEDQVRLIVRRTFDLMRQTPFGPTAIVTSDPTFFGMSRMLAILCEIQGGPQIAVFRKVQDGLDWLVRHTA